MNIKKTKKKLLFAMIFMYFIAPQIWGIWMTYKLHLITTKEYLHLLTSPITLAILITFFIVNRKYYSKKIDQCSNYSISIKRDDFLLIPKFHLISIVLFGTLGTFLAMLSLKFPSLGFFDIKAINFDKVIAGTLAGASLTFIFFFLFTSIIIGSFEKIIFQKYQETHKIFVKYLPFNIILVMIGAFLMFFSTIESLSIINQTQSVNDFIYQLKVSTLTLIIPLTAGTFLIFKQIKSSEKNYQLQLSSTDK